MTVEENRVALLREFLAGAPKDLWLLYLLKYLESYSYFALSYILILFLSDEFNLTDEKAGLVYGLHGMLISIYGLLMGSVIDTIGVKWSVTCGLFLLFITRCALVLTRSVHCLCLLLFFFMPLGSSLAVPVLQIGIKRVTLERHRVLAYSLFYCVMNLGALTAAPTVDLIRRNFKHGLGLNAFGFVTLDFVEPSLENTRADLSISAFRILILSGALVTLISLFVALALLRESEVLPDGSLCDAGTGYAAHAMALERRFSREEEDRELTDRFGNCFYPGSELSTQPEVPLITRGSAQPEVPLISRDVSRENVVTQQHYGSLLSSQDSTPRRGDNSLMESCASHTTSHIASFRSWNSEVANVPSYDSSRYSDRSFGDSSMSSLDGSFVENTGFQNALLTSSTSGGRSNAVDDVVVPNLERPSLDVSFRKNQVCVEIQKNLLSPIELYNETLRSEAFWRFFTLISLLIGVRVLYRYLDCLFPKYIVREFGPSARFGSIIALDPLIILFLVPFLGVYTSTGKTKTESLDMIIIGSAIACASPFWLALGSSYTTAVLFITTLSIGEAVWSPRLYEYTMRVAEPGREGRERRNKNNYLCMLWFDVTSTVGPGTIVLLDYKSGL